MKKIQKHIAFLLLAVLSVFIVPKELVHELHDQHHHDTVDTRSFDSDAQVGEQHHHCVVLQLSAPEYAHSIETINTKAPLFFIEGHVHTFEPDISGISYSLFLRGPPALA